MMLLLGLNRKHHGLRFLCVPRLSILVIVISLCHEEPTSSSLRAHTALRRLVVWRRLRSLPLSGPRVSLNAEGSVAHSLIGRFKPFLLVTNSECPRARLHHVELLAHDAILLTKSLNFNIFVHHVFKFAVLFFQDEQLLVEIVSSTLALKIQNVLQVLNLFL